MPTCLLCWGKEMETVGPVTWTSSIHESSEAPQDVMGVEKIGSN